MEIRPPFLHRPIGREQGAGPFITAWQSPAGSSAAVSAQQAAGGSRCHKRRQA